MARRETRAEKEDREIEALSLQWQAASDRWYAILADYNRKREAGQGAEADEAFAELRRATEASTASAEALTVAKVKRSDRRRREARKARRLAGPAAASTLAPNTNKGD
jgi:hypothetical protein